MRTSGHQTSLSAKTDPSALKSFKHLRRGCPACSDGKHLVPGVDIKTLQQRVGRQPLFLCRAPPTPSLYISWSPMTNSVHWKVDKEIFHFWDRPSELPWRHCIRRLSRQSEGWAVAVTAGKRQKSVSLHQMVTGKYNTLLWCRPLHFRLDSLPVSLAKMNPFFQFLLRFIIVLLETEILLLSYQI